MTTATFVISAINLVLTALLFCGLWVGIDEAMGHLHELLARPVPRTRAKNKPKTEAPKE